MRFLDRSSVPTPNSLTDANGVGQREIARAETHYAKDKLSRGGFKFKAYKGVDVVSALSALCNDKCAYCESLMKATSPADIEHYRPKGCVQEDATHEGYWWLAADWTNLLLSCIHCNRESHHHSITENSVLNGIQGDYKKSGKKDSFPICGPSYARAAGDDHDIEDPLLIDPTRRDPKRHLTWSSLRDPVAGRDLSVTSPIDTGNGPDRYGDVSIEIYGLNRRGLVEVRTALLLDLQTRLANLHNLIRIALKLSGPDLEDLLNQIERDCEAFYAFGQPEKEYSACAKTFIDAHAVALIERLDGLRTRAKI